MDGLGARRVVHVVRMFAGLAVAVLGHELGGHLGGGRLQRGVDATFEAAGGLGWNLVATGRTGDGHLIEVRGLQKNVLGVGGHFAIQAAHHTGKAEDARAAFAVRRIGDKQIFDAQVMFLAVQGGEFLTLVGAAHDNRAFELVEVVGVHRLAEVKHHVVGHVHGQGDGAHTGADQATAHPVGRVGVEVEVLDDARVVAVTTGHAVNRIVIVDFNIDVHRGAGLVVSRFRGLLVECHGRIGVGGTGGVVVFAGHATAGQRVATVRGDVDLKQRLVEVQQVHGVLTRLQSLVFSLGEAVLTQQDDAIVVVAQTQLTFGGTHAVGDVAVGLARFDLEVAGQHGTGQGDDDLFAGLHVGRAADDAARHLVAVFVSLVPFVAAVHVAPVDGLAVLLRFGGGVDHVADHNRAGHLRGVNLLFLKTHLDKVLGELFVGQASGNLDMVLEPIDIDHRHG